MQYKQHSMLIFNDFHIFFSQFYYITFCFDDELWLQWFWLVPLLLLVKAESASQQQRSVTMILSSAAAAAEYVIGSSRHDRGGSRVLCVLSCLTLILICDHYVECQRPSVTVKTGVTSVSGGDNNNQLCGGETCLVSSMCSYWCQVSFPCQCAQVQFFVTNYKTNHRIKNKVL